MIENVIENMTPDIRKTLFLLDKNTLESISEIRLKRGGYLTVVIKSRTYFINKIPRLCACVSDDCIKTGKTEFDRIFMSFCDYSVYRCSETLKDGFITFDGGVRIGAAGEAVYGENGIAAVKNISSLNIRIPVSARGCSKGVVSKIYKTEIPSIIVAGPPCSGKTTFLRDLAKQLSGGANSRYVRVCVVDERREICPQSNGVFDPEIGENTDVLTAFSKARGIEAATRALSPELIICDEIGNEAESEAVCASLLCGVSFALSVHVGTLDDLKRKGSVKRLLDTGEFKYVIFFDGHTYDPLIVNIPEEDYEINRNSGCFNFNHGSGNYVFGKSAKKCTFVP